MRVGGAKRKVADHVLHAVADAEGEAGGGAGDGTSDGAAGGPGDVAEGGAEGDHAVPAVEQVLRPPSSVFGGKYSNENTNPLPLLSRRIPDLLNHLHPHSAGGERRRRRRKRTGFGLGVIRISDWFGLEKKRSGWLLWAHLVRSSPVAEPRSLTARVTCYCDSELAGPL